jgi:hypothetical protein
LTRQQEIERKNQVAKKQGSKIIQEMKHLFYIEDDMWDPFCSSVLNVNKAAGDQKKKQSSHKSGVKNKFEKENVYSTERLTCGTRLAAVASTFIIHRG